MCGSSAIGSLAGGDCKNAVGELQLVRWRGGGWRGAVEGQWRGEARRGEGNTGREDRTRDQGRESTRAMHGGAGRGKPGRQDTDRGGEAIKWTGNTGRQRSCDERNLTRRG